MNRFHLPNNVLDILPNTIRIGLEELENRFLKMESSSLSNREFVDQISDSIKTFFAALEDAYCNDDRGSKLLQQLDGIEDGIQFIKGAMTNRLLADRYLYEPSLFNPHTMGSISKLYLFYESYVDLFERLVRNYNRLRNEAGANSRVSFLVDISKYSSVNAQNFVPLTCKKSPENVLVGITINEHVFFQIKGTMVLLLHEIGHYVRPFQRSKRNKTLLNIVNRWLKNMVYDQLKDYMDLDVLSFNLETKTPEEKRKINAARRHFEQRVFPIVDPIIFRALSQYFEEYIISDDVTSIFGKQDPYVSHIGAFQGLLEAFMTKLSNELSEILLVPSEERNQEDETEYAEENPAFGLNSKPSDFRLKNILRTILMEMVDVTKTENGEVVANEKVVYFQELCNEATRLFNSKQPFEYQAKRGPDAAIDAYLKFLSLFGLNEATPKNADLFVTALIRCLKRSLEIMKEREVLDMLVKNLEESLAHLFWIRTLAIDDFESYWAILGPLMQRASNNETERIKYFGIPNAIISEYFDLLEHDQSQPERNYAISPIDTKTPLPAIKTGNSAGAEKKWIEDLRYIVFIPIAEYLRDEGSIFPEKEFFQIENGTAIAKDRQAIDDSNSIIELRMKMREIFLKTKSLNNFSEEMQLINFFTDSNRG